MWEPSPTIRWSAVCGYLFPFVLVALVLLAVIVGGAVYAKNQVTHQLSRLVYNGTPSLPRGLYWTTPIHSFARGDLVVFPQPPAVRGLIQERHWLPARASLLKEVLAVPGDRMCTRGDRFVAAGRLIGPIPHADSAGRPLPRFDFCGTVPAGRLVVGSSSPGSFDSRHFGLVAIRDVAGLAEPLWTF